MSMRLSEHFLSAFKQLLPSLSPSATKGSGGRTAVIGGSPMYTGAPYHAAFAQLRAGSDLVYVLCYADAAPPLKALGPDLIVLPVLPLDEYEQRRRFELWCKQAGAVTCGSGLGRDGTLAEGFVYVLEQCAEKVLVGDGDFFWYVDQAGEKAKKAMRGVKRLIMTPNCNELKRLYKFVAGKELELGDLLERASKAGTSDSDVCEFDALKALPALGELFTYFDGGNAVFVLKGQVDIVLSEKRCYVVRNRASLKRCGGQGDLLSGLATLFALWAEEKTVEVETALAMASYVTRRASYEAFKKHKLGLVAQDIIPEISNAVNEFLDDSVLFSGDTSYGFTHI